MQPLMQASMDFARALLDPLDPQQVLLFLYYQFKLRIEIVLHILDVFEKRLHLGEVNIFELSILLEVFLQLVIRGFLLFLRFLNKYLIITLVDEFDHL